MSENRKCGPKSGRDKNGRFGPGNPGKPRGTKHKATRATEAMLKGQSEAITQKAIDLALAGDTTALRLCLERLSPAIKEAKLPPVDLPKIMGASDLPAAISAVLAEVGSGSLTPSEAKALTSLIGEAGRIYELTEIEKRLEALEASQG